MLPRSVCTMATAECASELRLFLKSLIHFHSTIPIVIGVSTNQPNSSQLRDVLTEFGVGKVFDNNSLANSSSKGGLSVTAIPLLNAHTTRSKGNNTNGTGTINRRQMEATPGIMFPTAHADFMMEKANVMDYALQLHDETLFLDCDMVFLRPLPTIPQPCSIGVSDHLIAHNDSAMFGKFNGGCFFVRDPLALHRWKKFCHRSRYFDQAAIEDVVASYVNAKDNNNSHISNDSKSVYYFPSTFNFGYWRLFQSAADGGLLTAIRRFKVESAARGGILWDGMPLLSVHSHMLMQPACRSGTTAVFNGLIKKWLNEVVHLSGDAETSDSNNKNGADLVRSYKLILSLLDA